MAENGTQDTDLVGMSAGDVLAFVEAEHAQRLTAERNILKAAYQWAVLHHPDRYPVGDKRRERAKPAGAAGTMLITEYAAASFGVRIQTTPYAAKRLIADAVDINLRLPKLAAGIEAGTVSVRHARHVAETTRDLHSDEAGWVDGEVAEVADGRLGWKRFEDLVEGKVAAAAPELARAKEELAAKDRWVRKNRVSKHGMGGLDVRADVTTIDAINSAITLLAERLKEKLPDASADERRVAALALLANPEAHADPSFDLDAGPVKVKVVAYLHLYGDSDIARLEGHGPVTTHYVRHLLDGTLGGLGGLAKAPKIRVTPVIDLNNQAPVDAYEIPATMREAVQLIHPADVFPYAINTSRRMDLDHAKAYAEGGETGVGNLGPLTRTHHRIKTHDTENSTGWEVRHPFPGIIIWRDPYGAHYLVDPTGTRRVTGTPGGDDEHALTPGDLYFTDFALNYAIN